MTFRLWQCLLLTVLFHFISHQSSHKVHPTEMLFHNRPVKAAMGLAQWKISSWWLMDWKEMSERVKC